MNGNKPVDVLKLLEMVAFAPENAMEAATTNSVLYTEAIQYRLQRLERAYLAEKDWEQAAAEADLKLRKEARDADERITEAQIKNRILLDKRVAALADAHHRAEIYEEYSKLVVKVFEMRSEMLKAVISMVNRELPAAQAAAQAAEKMKAERRKLKEKFPDGE
jgi:hypothetical protein